MELIKKSDIKNILGEYGFLSVKKPKILINKLKYLGGCKAFDEEIENNKIDLKNLILQITAHPKGFQLSISNNFFKTYTIAITYEQVLYWFIEKQKTIAEKNKSIVGRALVGGLLLGPVGAIVGGMTGVGNKKIKKNEIDNIIGISVIDKNKKESIILFSCSDKNLEYAINYFEKDLKNKFKENNDNKNDKKNSIINEITKLKKLLDSGAITEGEYKKLKNNIIE